MGEDISDKVSISISIFDTDTDILLTGQVNSKALNSPGKQKVNTLLLSWGIALS